MLAITLKAIILTILLRRTKVQRKIYLLYHLTILTLEVTTGQHNRCITKTIKIIRSRAVAGTAIVPMPSFTVILILLQLILLEGKILTVLITMGVQVSL